MIEEQIYSYLLYRLLSISFQQDVIIHLFWNTKLSSSIKINIFFKIVNLFNTSKAILLLERTRSVSPTKYETLQSFYYYYIKYICKFSFNFVVIISIEIVIEGYTHRFKLDQILQIIVNTIFKGGIQNKSFINFKTNGNFEYVLIVKSPRLIDTHQSILLFYSFSYFS